jgi:hypothetical protein
VPNAQQTVDATASFYLYQGVLGGTCVLLLFLLAGAIWIARRAFDGWAACQEARVADAKLATDALSRPASTNAEIATMMAALREGRTEMMRITSLIQRDAENDDERLQEILAGLVKAIEDMDKRVESTCRGVA